MIVKNELSSDTMPARESRLVFHRTGAGSRLAVPDIGRSGPTRQPFPQLGTVPSDTSVVALLRRMRLAARLVVCFAAVGILFSVGIVVGGQGLGAQSDSVQRVRRLMVLMHQVDEQKYYDGDI